MTKFDEKIKSFEEKIKDIEKEKIFNKEKISEKPFFTDVNVSKFLNTKFLIKTFLFLLVVFLTIFIFISYRFGVVNKNELIGTEIIKADVLKIIPSDKGGLKIESLDRDVYEGIVEKSVNVKPKEKKYLDLEKDKKGFLKNFANKKVRDIKNSKRLIETNVDDVAKNGFVIDDFSVENKVKKVEKQKKTSTFKEKVKTTTKPLVIEKKKVVNKSIPKKIERKIPKKPKKFVNKYQKLYLDGWYINIGSYKTLGNALQKYKSFISFHEYLSENDFSIEQVGSKFKVYIFTFKDKNDVNDTCDYIREFNSFCIGERR